MITFLPYADFNKTMACLDDARLGQQRREAAWMVRTLLEGKTWAVSRMWQGYTDALCYYGMAACEAWHKRGKKDELWTAFYLGLQIPLGQPAKAPAWLGSRRLHGSHRGRLLLKDVSHYRQFGWQEQMTSTYFWPPVFYNWRIAQGDGPDICVPSRFIPYPGDRLKCLPA